MGRLTVNDQHIIVSVHVGEVVVGYWTDRYSREKFTSVGVGAIGVTIPDAKAG